LEAVQPLKYHQQVKLLSWKPYNQLCYFSEFFVEGKDDIIESATRQSRLEYCAEII